MFAEIAPNYDRINGMMSLSLHRRWRAHAVSLLNLQPGDAALDVCCGTGDFLVPLRNAVGGGGMAVGADYCAPMLDIASKKTGSKRLALADACALPVATGRFDALTVGWGLRNLADLDAGLREAARVLKPGGRMLSLDMAIPRNPAVRAVSGLICGSVLPVLGRLFGSKEAYTYLPKSAEQFATREELRAAFESAGFEDVRWKDLIFGNICIVWGRKR